MSADFSYKSDDYDKQTQRFVIPLYVKDELNTYVFSSTGSLVTYKGHHYILFAAHALEDDIEFEKLNTFGTDGNFLPLARIAIGYQIFKEQDIGVVDCFNQRLENKNYFDLEEKSLIGFEKKHFAWTGFPVSQCISKVVHNSISSDTLRDKYIHSDVGGTFFKNARYFTIISKINTNNNIEITGSYNRNNTSLKYKGLVSTGPHPQGMSGGALYYFSKKQNLKPNLEDSFRFAGIGLKYRKDNTIFGVPAFKIIELLERLNEENPLQINIASNTEMTWNDE
ncbi:hypothetical protein [Herminiimonas aquatilis]|uniref:Trypsin-like peptidase n=1 Tax=Herminiimonas aquatilis TaxID=345342 RepID=A0ABW2J4B3_9BURK